MSAGKQKGSPQGTGSKTPDEKRKGKSKQEKELTKQQTGKTKDVQEQALPQTKKAKEDTEHLQQENVTLQEEKGQLQQGDENLKEEQDQLQQDNENLKGKQDQLQQDNENLKGKQDQLQQDNENLKEEKDQLQQDNGKLKSEKDQLLQENHKLKEEIKTLQEFGQKYEKLKEEKDQLRLANGKLKSQLNTKQQDLENKYEQLLSHLMARDTEGQEMLNDPLRPSQVADRWRHFKDQVYFGTYQDLKDKVKDKRERRKVLLDFCQVIYEQQRKKEDDFEKVFQDLLTPIFQGKDAEKELTKALLRVMGEKWGLFKLSSKEVDQVTEEAVEVYRRSRTFLADMQTQVLGAIKNRWKKAESPDTPEPNIKELLPKKSDLPQYSDTCRDYVTECHALCRLMMMQVPSMHLSFDAVQGSEFNRGHFTVHDGPDAGDVTVDQVVLPALLRSRGGKVMEKGLATVKE